MSTFGSVSRRTLLGSAIAAGGACALGMPFRRAAAQADYPSETFQVIVPTRQGGGAERLARAFDTVCGLRFRACSYSRTRGVRPAAMR